MKRVFIIIFVSLLTAGLAFYCVEKLLILKASASAGSKNVHMVSLLKDKADPDIVLIKVGDYVQFNSKDGKNHDLEQGHGEAYGDVHQHIDSAAGSGNFKADEAYKVQFKKVGIFEFHDHYNPKIHITVVANNK
jgi:plastocyanin